ncbi:hypothetical protein EMCRGX_G004085 [Ephydatia muelleri]
MTQSEKDKGKNSNECNYDELKRIRIAVEGILEHLITNSQTNKGIGGPILAYSGPHLPHQGSPAPPVLKQILPEVQPASPSGANHSPEYFLTTRFVYSPETITNMQLLTLIVIAGQLLLARSLLYKEYPILETYKGAVPLYVEDKLLSVGIVVYEDYASIKSTVGKNFNIGDYTAAKGEKTSGALEDSIVYEVSEIVRENKDTDWIVLRTTKGFTHTPVTKFELAKDIPLAGTPVYVLGHPLGMPLRYAEGELAKSADSQNQIAALTSGFAGNSGSPVITKDGKVVGLFSNYEDGDNNANDFVKSKSGSCYDLAITSVKNPVLVKGPAARIIRPDWQDSKREEL